MIERPILFNGDMVRAILDGTKTQTRRIVKLNASGRAQCKDKNWHVEDPDAILACPYGQVGDRLWVRETWGVISYAINADGDMIEWTPDRPATHVHELKHGRGYYTGHVIYAADGDHEWAGDDDGGGERRSAWHPSIHMPRSASRITLEITNVRIERLQDISEADAMAEGVKAVSVFSATRYAHNDDGFFGNGKDTFRDLWSSIYRNWDSNPWVWVIEFRPINGKATQGETGAVNFQNSRK
ncbi:hypothetical protein ICN48_06875 [Polynucleobacter sp. JS-Safj-400b-B2]|uniref:hypothetical protein n=1 Tax=Polynucleobacter sp. JS-Safj-400b-B2 TaxID=2576921 RepID=UPI001C0CF5AB|nr:hypothetical protein [Polynucleobacter sp. JS-Safj-400b-B2]MBU3625956.1 hypothetical protein [Polynucleobacter sp. JS-Safj-400b-B2]